MLSSFDSPRQAEGTCMSSLVASSVRNLLGSWTRKYLRTPSKSRASRSLRDTFSRASATWKMKLRPWNKQHTYSQYMNESKLQNPYIFFFS